MKLNGLEKFFKTDQSICNKIIDFQQIDIMGRSPLIFAFIFNKSHKFNLNTEQFDYLIKNSNLTQFTKYNKIPITYAFRFNFEENLKLNQMQFNYLILNSNLKHIDLEGRIVLHFALRYHQTQYLNLSKEQWKYLIVNSDLSLITDKDCLIELKKIQSEFINDSILNNIYIKNTKEYIYKNIKI